MPTLQSTVDLILTSVTTRGRKITTTIAMMRYGNRGNCKAVLLERYIAVRVVNYLHLLCNHDHNLVKRFLNRWQK